MSSLSAAYNSGYNIVSLLDAIVPIKQTTKGGLNILAVSGDFGGLAA